MVEPYLVYLGTAILGGFLSMVVPYLIKTWQDNSVSFDWTYVYGLCISTILSVVVLIPETDVIDFKTVMLVFLAALGLNTGINKANTIRIKRNGG